MNALKSSSIISLLFAGVLIAHSCSGESNPESTSAFAGSTPADQEIKSQLGIDFSVKVDFIKWKLFIDPSYSTDKTFTLQIEYGESQPNTTGFKQGGTKQIIDGIYTELQKNNGKLSGECYQLSSNQMSGSLYLLKINDNLLHILNEDSQLLRGNGGWSYMLNRLEPISETPIKILSVQSSPFPVSDSAHLGTFSGRTGCNADLLALNGIRNGCNRIKWLLTLNQDPIHHTPAGFTIKTVYVGTGNNQYTSTGQWQVKQGIPADSAAIIYLLTTEINNQPVRIGLLKADDNILYFLDQNMNLLVGNEELSYTLNKTD